MIEPDEDGFHAFVPALPGCHTFGATTDEARANMAEAIELHIESLAADHEPIPVAREPFMITRLSVPVHKGRDVPTGTLCAILRDADISIEQFRELL